MDSPQPFKLLRPSRSLIVVGCLLILHAGFYGKVLLTQGTVKFWQRKSHQTVVLNSAVASVSMRQTKTRFGWEVTVPVLELDNGDSVEVRALAWYEPFGISRGSTVLSGKRLAKGIGVPFLPDAQHVTSVSV
jgi:hypothetical protein